jgi:hypothetical protein
MKTKDKQDFSITLALLIAVSFGVMLAVAQTLRIGQARHKGYFL